MVTEHAHTIQQVPMCDRWIRGDWCGVDVHSLIGTVIGGIMDVPYEKLSELCVHCGHARLVHGGMKRRGLCAHCRNDYHVFKSSGVENVRVIAARFAPVTHVVALVTRKGRVFGCNWAQPFPADVTEVLKAYRKDPTDFHPYDESTGNFIAL